MKLLIMRNFTFSNSVCKTLVLQTHENTVLFGKGIKITICFFNPVHLYFLQLVLTNFILMSLPYNYSCIFEQKVGLAGGCKVALIIQEKMYLTLSQTSSGFNMSALQYIQVFSKHCEKRRN